MLKKALALAGLTISLSVNAEIVDLGIVTRDTNTGLDWLDLTETKNLTISEVYSLIGAGGEFSGYRYATHLEVSQLWKNFGITNGYASDIDFSDTVEYENFNNAVALLGSTVNELSHYDYGSFGITGTRHPVTNRVFFAAGLVHIEGDYKATSVTGYVDLTQGPTVNLGSYLVKEFEMPIL